MACKGGGQGVMAMIELEKISNEIKKIMSGIDKDLEVSVLEIETIKQKLKGISDDNSKLLSEKKFKDISDTSKKTLSDKNIRNISDNKRKNEK